MKKCTFIYKCRGCGEEYEGPIGGYDPAIEGLMNAIFNFEYPKRFFGMPPNLKDIHHCKDKKFVGVADLQGFKIDEE